MARPREFEPREVTERAMHVFWSQGVEQTSVSDLVAATGVQRSGLYSEFGSKDGLFRRSFELYLDVVVRPNFARYFADPNADLDTIVAYFGHFREIVRTPLSERGCLMCNTAASPAVAAAEVQDLIESTFLDIERYFRAALENSRRTGLLESPKTDDHLAAWMLANVLSLSNLCRSPGGRRLVDGFVDELLQALGELRGGQGNRAS